MKKLIALTLMMVVSSSCYAEQYKLEPQYCDIGVGKGLSTTRGSYNNPYVGKNGGCGVMVRPQFMTVGDSNLSRPGSSSNPWILYTND